jgi:hypothetical protein
LSANELGKNKNKPHLSVKKIRKNTGNELNANELGKNKIEHIHL